MPNVQIIRHAPCETPGILSYLLEDKGVSSTTHRAYDGASLPASLMDADGLIIMGGPMGVQEQDRFPFLTREIQLLEEALEREIPILGICLGSQLLAATLGARVNVGKHKEIGWFPDALTAAAGQDPLWKGIESPFTAFHWRQDAFDLPWGSIRLASSAWTLCQAFRYGRNAYGLQFHLEVTQPIIMCMVDAFENELREAGFDGDVIAELSSLYIPRLHQIGEAVLGRWVDIVSRDAKRRATRVREVAVPRALAP